MNSSPLEIATALSELFSEEVDVEELVCQSQGEASLFVVEMRYTRIHVSGSGNHQQKHIRQTAVVLRDADLDLPQIALEPRFEGMVGALFALMGNLGAVEFADTPEFNKQFRVVAFNEPATRVLLTRELREFMSARTGWSIRGNRQWLVAYRQNERVPADQLKSFQQTALPILGLFQQGEEDLDQRPEIRRETSVGDMTAAAQKAGGLVGQMVERQLRQLAVSQKELEEFIHSRPRRSIPIGIARQVIGQNGGLLVIGAILMVVGVVAPAVIWNAAKGNERFLAIPFVVVFLLGGALMTGITIWYRRRKKRLLQQGELVIGRIENVKATYTEVNNQRRYHVHICYPSKGAQRTTIANAYGMAVDRARLLQTSEQQVRLLVDPQKETHVVCLDLLTVFED